MINKLRNTKRESMIYKTLLVKKNTALIFNKRQVAVSCGHPGQQQIDFIGKS